MLLDSSYLCFFLSCVLSLLSLKALSKKNPWQLPVRPLLHPPSRQPQLSTSHPSPQPKVCPRYHWKNLLPPPTPVSETDQLQTTNSGLNFVPVVIVVTTVIWRLSLGSERAPSVDKTPDVSEPREGNTELSFLTFYTLLDSYA